MNTEHPIEPALHWLKERIPQDTAARAGIVLGSGWGQAVDRVMDIQMSFDYADIPGFPVSTVPGHTGRLLLGTLSGVAVWVMQGRFHYYEGYSMAEVTLPIRLFSRLGVKGLLLTNAAGGIDPGYKPGDFMLIRDHINFMGTNPLRGPNDDAVGPRFPDMTEAWDKPLQEILKKAGCVQIVPMHTGVYLAVSGPCFETPAEIKAFQALGADAVGMSTVPECIVARHCGMRVAGISCITNVAAHEGGDPLSHDDVSRAAQKAELAIVRLLNGSMPAFNEELGGESHAS